MTADTHGRTWALRGVIGCSTAALLGVVLGGCDGGGGGGLGQGHDFGPNDSNVVAALGDSITAGGDVYSAYPSVLGPMIGKTVLNYGVGGVRSSYGAEIVNHVLAGARPGYTIVFYGANDAIHGIDPQITVGSLRYIVATVRTNRSIPILLNVMPMMSYHAVFDPAVDAINELLPAMAEQEGVVLVDIHAVFEKHPEYLLLDGLHPNEGGVEAIARAIADLF